MGWERRGNRWYYYRAERAGGRVVKEYVPPLLAGATAAITADRRNLRAEAAADRRRVRAELDALDAPLKQLDALADLVAAAALVAAGYRRHHRGEWRKKRGELTDRSTGTDPVAG